MIYSLPFAVQPFAAALSAVDPRLVEASHTLGVSHLATFFRVSLPIAAPGVVAGAVLTFAHALGEFGVVLMVGGSIPGETKTVALAIYDRVQAFDVPGAGLMSAAPLLLSIFAMRHRVPDLVARAAQAWTGGLNGQPKGQPARRARSGAADPARGGA